MSFGYRYSAYIIKKIISKNYFQELVEIYVYEIVFANSINHK